MQLCPAAEPQRSLIQTLTDEGDDDDDVDDDENEGEADDDVDEDDENDVHAVDDG